MARFPAAHDRVGRRPMRQLLARDGIACPPGMVHRIMAEQGLQARPAAAPGNARPGATRAARTAHIANHCRDATGQRSVHQRSVLGRNTVGDITYLPTREGWLYLAVVLDLATRAVIGWAMRPTLHTELVTAALAMAHQHGHLTAGAIFHSDRGSQYTSHDIPGRLCRAGRHPIDGGDRGLLGQCGGGIVLRHPQERPGRRGRDVRDPAGRAGLGRAGTSRAGTTGGDPTPTTGVPPMIAWHQLLPKARCPVS